MSTYKYAATGVKLTLEALFTQERCGMVTFSSSESRFVFDMFTRKHLCKQRRCYFRAIKMATSKSAVTQYNTIQFALSIDLILCALSQRYNPASFLSQAVTEKDQTSRRKAQTTKEGKREMKARTQR